MASVNIQNRCQKLWALVSPQISPNPSSDLPRCDCGQVTDPLQVSISLFIKRGENKTHLAGLLRWLNVLFTQKYVIVPGFGKRHINVKVLRTSFPHISIQHIAPHPSDPLMHHLTREAFPANWGHCPAGPSPRQHWPRCVPKICLHMVLTHWSMTSANSLKARTTSESPL